MPLSTNLISGLSSGFDWRSMIDELMAIEHRRVDLVENQKSEYESKIEILKSLNTKLSAFKTQAGTLANSDAFNVFTSSLSTNSTTYSASDFFSLSTSTSASPGTHTIEMDSNSKVAQARKISSRSFSDYDTALGLTDGAEFVINGRVVKLEDTDDLLDIRDKINNLNTGTNATGVTASVLTVSTDNYRLILTSDNTGEDAFTILDASGDLVNILQNSDAKPGLGFLDSTTPTIKNTTSDGAESNRFSSSDVAVGTLLGLDNAQDGTLITVGTTTLDIDLATESLTIIAGKINALSGVSASVKSSITEDGVTKYYIDISGTTTFSDKNNVLQTLGVLGGGQSDVAEVLEGSVANKKKSAPAEGIIGTTTFDDINNYTPGTSDTITISGTKHDGAIVDAPPFNVYSGGYKNLNALLAEIESQFGLGAGSATLDSTGKITITDTTGSTAGDSQLSISLVANNEGWSSGGTLDFGTITTTTEGYDMELRAGQDAVIKIDGTTITSSGNAINDVISGVTLNLKTVESGKSVDLNISRDYNTIKSSVQGLLDTYNNVLMDINEQFYYDEETQTAGPLQGDATLNSIKSNLQNIVVNAITRLPPTINALSLIGINSEIDFNDHKNDGKLSIDDDDFMDALEDNFAGVRRIFVAEGTTTDGDVEYISHTNETVASEYDVNITKAATQAYTTGTVDLSSGIGAGDIEILTITQGGKTAAIVLDGDTDQNGSTIDNIVNAINSELYTEYTQSIMGDKKNTTSNGTTAITSSTLWSAVYSGGVDAGLVTGQEYEITFSGYKQNGQEASGSYTISDADVDTVQGLLSAIEAAYENEVSASINTYGYLTITDNSTGNSSSAITITEPVGKNLDFGNVTTSNLVGDERVTKDTGANAITATDAFSDIDSHGLSGSETIYYYGHKSNGVAVEGSYTLQADLSDTLQSFLTDIGTAYGGDVVASIQDGRIVLTDGSTNSTLGLEIIEPGNVDFGTVSGGVTGRYAVDVTASKDGTNHLVMTHDDYGSSATFSISQSESDDSDLLGAVSITAGVDVEGTINDESATGSGQVLTGDAPGIGETTSVEGLVIKYTGDETGDQGKVKITMGVAELFDRVLYGITNAADGYLDFRLESMADRVDDFEDDIEEMEARLSRKMVMMINKFVAMELALSKIQKQSSWLTGQVNAAFSGWV